MFTFLAGVVTKQALLLAIVFYAFPILWWSYNDMDHHTTVGAAMEEEEEEDSYFLSVRFLMSTGALLTLMGMGYVALPIDLVPDFIPIFGGMDDAMAKMTAGAGIMMAYLGYQFGSGTVPREFVILVTLVNQAYDVVVPLLQNYLLPVLIPAVKAMAIPMKKLAESVLGNSFTTMTNSNNFTDALFHRVLEQAVKTGAGTEL